MPHNTTASDILTSDFFCDLWVQSANSYPFLLFLTYRPITEHTNTQPTTDIATIAHVGNSKSFSMSEFGVGVVLVVAYETVGEEVGLLVSSWLVAPNPQQIILTTQTHAVRKLPRNLLTFFRFFP